jgi:hypothetical protein
VVAAREVRVIGKKGPKETAGLWARTEMETLTDSEMPNARRRFFRGRYFFRSNDASNALRRSRLTAPVRGFPAAEQVPDQTQHELDHRERQEDGEEDQLQEAR